VLQGSTELYQLICKSVVHSSVCEEIH
jgi:hypothetical protein